MTSHYLITVSDLQPVFALFPVETVDVWDTLINSHAPFHWQPVETVDVWDTLINSHALFH